MVLSAEGELTLHQLAAKVSLGANKLNAGFKEIFGHPVSRHRFEDKMLSALRLLDHPNSNSEEIAACLGYSDPRLFLKEFRKRFGYTPVEKHK